MKLLSTTCLLLALSASNANAAGEYRVGESAQTVVDPSRHRRLATHVWYPVDAKAPVTTAPDKGPFVPVRSAWDAPVAAAPAPGFPVVLLSHGSGGKADKLFWLTERLVRQGYVVVAVDHPGNMTGDNSADGMIRIWDRARDLSFALDRVLERPEFKSHLDQARVAAAGHSAGGTTALLLAGARFSSARLTSPIPSCAGTRDPYLATLCTQMSHLDLRAYDKSVVDGDYSDPRVKAIVGLDPGFARSLDVESLKRMKSKSLVFVADRLNAPQDEIHSKDFLNLLPASKVEVVPGAIHMTFLQACKAGFPKDDPELSELCADNDQKMKSQTMVADKIAAFLAQSLGVAH